MPDNVARSFILKDRIRVWYLAVQGHQDMEGAMDRLQDFKRFVSTDGIWGVILDMRLLYSFPDPANWSLFAQGVRLTLPAGLRWACIRGAHPAGPVDVMVQAGRDAGARVQVFDSWVEAVDFVGLSQLHPDPLDDSVLLLD